MLYKTENIYYISNSPILAQELYMKVKYQNSLEYKLLQRIQSIPGNIILRQDIKDLADRRQLSRALDRLITKGKLAKISFGIFAKTKKSEYTGKILLAAPFSSIVKEALNRLEIKWDLTSAQRAYNEGLSTQIPVKPGVKLKSRCRRKFTFDKNIFYFEDNCYAR